MYNIDFKVSDVILSIPVCINDSISTLISRMHQLQPFQKISRPQIEQKLLKCLKKVVVQGKIQSKIINKIKQLIDNVQSIQRPISMESGHKKQENVNNKTFINLLQQSSLNTSYLTNYNASEPKLLKKYPLQSEEFQYGDQVIEKKLLCKYDLKGNQQYHSKASNKININSLINSKQNRQPYKTFHNDQRIFERNYKIQTGQRNQPLNYLKYDQRQDRVQAHKIAYKNYNHTFNQQTNTQADPKKEINNKKLTKILPYQKDLQFIAQIEKKYAKQNYNPVPKLNQLIQKSRSLSQIAQRDYGARINKVQYAYNKSKMDYSAKFEKHQENYSLNKQYKSSQINNKVEPREVSVQKYSTLQRNNNLEKRNSVGKILHKQNKTKYSYL